MKRSKIQKRQSQHAKKGGKEIKHSKTWKKFIFFLIPIVIWLIYTGILIDGRFKVFPDELNYFKDLSLSFSQARLDIDRPFPWMHDLVFFKGKYYLYWPPVPALVYIPFTALWGRNTPDTCIANSFGALNVLLLMIVLNLFSKRYSLKPGYAGIIFLSVFWALGTVHFYMSRTGSVWYISQVMAQTFLMLYLVCI